MINSRIEAAKRSVDGFEQAVQQHGSLLECLVRGQRVSHFEHFPSDDVVDQKSGSQYFYHAHRTGQSEHGHLHLFWHADSLGRRCRRDKTTGISDWRPTHLFAIGMSNTGLPTGLFTTNLWVTDGYWFDAERAHAIVKRFTLFESGPFEAVNRFLNGFVHFYFEEIGAMLRERDARIKSMLKTRSWQQVCADEDIEVLSYRSLDWVKDIDHL